MKHYTVVRYIAGIIMVFVGQLIFFEYVPMIYRTIGLLEAAVVLLLVATNAVGAYECFRKR